MPSGTMTPTESKMGPVYVLRVRVVDVDARRHTVDVISEKDGRPFPDVQVSSQMWHYSGVGQRNLPLLDARALLTIPSDDTPPTITNFIDLPSPVTESDLEAETGADVDQPDQDDVKLSFAGAAYPALPGDQQFLGADGSFLLFRTGGVLQEDSSAFCQRFYFPLDNHVRDLAENYELITVGGDLILESMRAEDSDDGSAGFRFRLVLNKDLEDDKASVLMEAGKLDNNLLFRLAVAPLGIDRAQGTATNPPFYATVDEDGSVDGKADDWVWSLTGDLTETVRGKISLHVGSSISLQAQDFTETILGTKKISATSIKLSGQVSFGESGTPLAVNAAAFMAWAATHEHPPGGGPPTTPPPDIIARNIFS